MVQASVLGGGCIRIGASHVRPSSSCSTCICWASIECPAYEAPRTAYPGPNSWIIREKKGMYHSIRPGLPGTKMRTVRTGKMLSSRLPSADSISTEKVSVGQPRIFSTQRLTTTFPSMAMVCEFSNVYHWYGRCGMVPPKWRLGPRRTSSRPRLVGGWLRQGFICDPIPIF